MSNPGLGITRIRYNGFNLSQHPCQHTMHTLRMIANNEVSTPYFAQRYKFFSNGSALA